jgi:hypothetical protein
MALVTSSQFETRAGISINKAPSGLLKEGVEGGESVTSGGVRNTTPWTGEPFISSASLSPGPGAGAGYGADGSSLGEGEYGSGDESLPDSPSSSSSATTPKCTDDRTKKMHRSNLSNQLFENLIVVCSQQPINHAT